jgi:NAD-dependent deacetylase
MTDTQVEIPGDLVSKLKAARRVLVLTGAGMSAESGVPTFRDAQTGLWAKYKAEELATPEAFRANPKMVWDWYMQRRDNIHGVHPHAGHEALVAMERHFETLLVVTQNVDSLHQRAGSSDVVELHGNIMQSICSETGKLIDDDWIAANPGSPPASPHHPKGLARPGVVWFGEMLPEAAINRAIEEAQRCDACFSIGTSSLVQPAASLPYVALEAGALLVEINPEPTPMSQAAHFSLHATAAVALPQLAAALAS